MDGFVCGTGFATGVATRASHAVNVRPQFAVMGTMGRTIIGPGAVRECKPLFKSQFQCHAREI
ncbi:MAG: hypothetical protein JWM45_2582 [Pseudonocardiales bacterium]|nr:hypothetical protein [Pseudonocardiales bacterium]